MIEAYLQDSLKAIFMTISEYLQSVPQDEPFQWKQDAEEQDDGPGIDIQDVSERESFVEETNRSGYNLDTAQMSPNEGFVPSINVNNVLI